MAPVNLSRGSWTYIAAQSGVGLGSPDLGQVLRERVLVFGLFVVGFVVELEEKHTDVTLRPQEPVRR